jgi:MFS family permease
LLFICEALTRTSSMMVFMSIALTGRYLAPDPSLATLPLALVPVAMTITTIPAAQMMRRLGRRAGFQLAAVLGVTGAVTCVVALWTEQFAGLCAGGFLIGSVNGFATYYRFAASEAAPEEYRSRAISLVMAGGVIAAFVGAAMATATKDLNPSAPFLGTFAAIAGADPGRCLFFASTDALGHRKAGWRAATAAIGGASDLRAGRSGCRCQLGLDVFANECDTLVDGPASSLLR